MDNLPFEHVQFSEVSHVWSQLADEGKKVLMKNEMFFQGKKMQLIDLLKDNSEVLELISLQDLIAKKRIKIGEKIQLHETEFYMIDRFVKKGYELARTIKSFYEFSRSLTNDIIDLSHYLSCFESIFHLEF